MFCCGADFFPMRQKLERIVKLVVGVRKRDKTKIQSCITALVPVCEEKKKAVTIDVTALNLPQGYMWELLQESGHRWRGFLLVRKPIRDMFYFPFAKVGIFM